MLTPTLRVLDGCFWKWNAASGLKARCRQESNLLRGLLSGCQFFPVCAVMFAVALYSSGRNSDASLVDSAKPYLPEMPRQPTGTFFFRVFFSGFGRPGVAVGIGMGKVVSYR